MKRFISIILLTILFAVAAYTQNPKVFVAPMENSFHDFLTAALISERLPISIVTDETQADYIISGGSVKGQNKWYDTVFGAERDRNQGSIRLLKVSENLAWAGAAGDRSIWWGALKSGGQKKVASRLARKLKKDFFNGKPKP